MNKNNLEFEIRQSQLLSPFGAGSIFENGNEPVMIKDSEDWNISDENKIHDFRLEQAMDASGFVAPPIKESSDRASTTANIFPKWFFSPKTRELKSIDSWRKEIKDKNAIKFKKSPYDPKHPETSLVPVRIVCVCEHGHAQDFPWSWWAHHHMEHAKDYKNHKLFFEKVGSTGRFSDYQVTCKTCNEKSIMNVFNDNLPVPCEGKYGWKTYSSKNEKCDAKVKVMMRNASNFYFPNVFSSVNIPIAESNIASQITSHPYYGTIKVKMDRNESQDKSELLETDSLIKNLVTDLETEVLQNDSDHTQAEIHQTLLKLFEIPVEIDAMAYRKAEFDVLSGKNTSYDHNSNLLSMTQYTNEKFRDLPEAHRFGQLIDGITLVNKLEVVSALRGYSRIEPVDKESLREREHTGGTAYGQQVKEVSLKRNDGCYVGMKFLGEGIFIDFNANAIQGWLERNRDSKTFKNINEKVKHVIFEGQERYVEPGYYMLHTFSHLIIRELNLTCGYSSSALHERLYYSNDSEHPMYGLLIYTSSSDADGTLGGLVSQGLPKRLFNIINNAIEKAKWCSFDPVCIETVGQGSNSLNSAACHACCLISETSCEQMNLFLDRKTIVGELDSPIVGLFSREG